MEAGDPRTHGEAAAAAPPQMTPPSARPVDELLKPLLAPPTASAPHEEPEPDLAAGGVAEPAAESPSASLSSPLAAPVATAVRSAAPVAEPATSEPPAGAPAASASPGPLADTTVQVVVEQAPVTTPTMPVPAAAASTATADPDPGEMFPPPRSATSPGHRTSSAENPVRLPMWPFRVLSIAGVALAFVLYGWQVFRVIDEQERLASLDWAPILVGAFGAVGVVLWTYTVAENARRVYSPARTQAPPDPGRAAATWIVPLAFAFTAAIVVTVLSRRLNSPVEGTESEFPLMLGVVAILVAFPVMYGPVKYLSDVVRKVGGKGIKLGEWLLVPVTLALVGALMIISLRVGGTFGDDVDGLAPTWVVAIAAIVPATVVVLLGWRSAESVEADITRAFDRRTGRTSSLTRRRGKLVAMFSDDGPNHVALSETGHIRQVPGVSAVSVAVTAGLAGLALLSVVGALVMYLFWQEGRDGVLLPNQIDRAWEVLATLQDVERAIAFFVLAAGTVWTAAIVVNVRLASARRRNPMIAALAWPLAGLGIWIVGDRFVIDGSAQQVVVGFALQALLLYVPFALLERSAGAVGARRTPFRIASAVGVVLLVHVQGLGGLSTLTPSSDVSEIGHLVGYLAVGALVQLLATFAVTDATRSLNSTTEHVAGQHNQLVEQRAHAGARQPASYQLSADRA